MYGYICTYPRTGYLYLRTHLRTPDVYTTPNIYTVVPRILRFSNVATVFEKCSIVRIVHGALQMFGAHHPFLSLNLRSILLNVRV